MRDDAICTGGLEQSICTSLYVISYLIFLHLFFLFYLFHFKKKILFVFILSYLISYVIRLKIALNKCKNSGINSVVHAWLTRWGKILLFLVILYVDMYLGSKEGDSNYSHSFPPPFFSHLWFGTETGRQLIYVSMPNRPLSRAAGVDFLSTEPCSHIFPYSRKKLSIIYDFLTAANPGIRGVSLNVFSSA